MVQGVGHRCRGHQTQRAVTGDVVGSRAALAEAVATLELLSPGQALARAYAYRAEEELLAGDTEDAVAFADRALALVADDETQIVALHVRGDARCSMGELAAGLEDLDRALRMAEEGGRVGDVITSRSYLAEWRWATEGPRVGLAEWETALELAERRNVHSQATYAKGAALWVLLEAGAWDRVLGWSDDLLSLPEGRVDPAVTIVARVVRGHVLLARGRRAEVGDPADLLSLTERTQELAALAPALVLGAEVALADGDVATAVARLERFERVTDGVAPEYRAVGLVRAVRLALACDRRDLAERLAAGARPHALRDRLRMEAASAMLAEAHGEPDAADAYARLADRLRDYGDPFEEAMALLGVARTAGDADASERARAILQHLGIAS